MIKVKTSRFLVIDGKSKAAGSVLSLPKALADKLVSRGHAEKESRSKVEEPSAEKAAKPKKTNKVG